MIAALLSVIVLATQTNASNADENVLDTTPITELPEIGVHVPSTPFPDELREMLLNFRAVEARLVQGNTRIGDGDEEPARSYGGYPPRSEPIPLTPGQLDELVHLLIVESPHIKKLCTFSPNISYGFNDEDRTLLVLVCNTCAEAIFQWDSSDLFWRIDRSNLDLIRFGLTLFPKDELLQKLMKEN